MTKEEKLVVINAIAEQLKLILTSISPTSRRLTQSRPLPCAASASKTTSNW